MLWWTIQHSLVVAALAAVVAVFCRVGRLRPAVEHALWVVVLLKLLAPSPITWPWSVPDVSATWIGDESTAEPFRPSEMSDSQPNTNELPLATPADRPLPPSAIADDDAEELIARVIVGGGNASADSDEPASNPWAAHPSPTETALSDETASPSFSPAAGTLRLAARSGVWSTLLIALWAGGGFVVASVHLHRIFRTRQQLYERRPAPNWLTDRVAGLAKTVGVAAPEVIVCPSIRSPCLWCLVRPTLVWPEVLTDGVRCEHWQGVIVHELAHLRRRDHWWAWLELVGGCVWWFHPLFWLVRNRLRESAELACDAWAVWALPGGERQYAESLVEVTRLVSRAAAPAPALGASARARRSLDRRLTMILSQSIPCKLPLAAIVGAMLLAVLALPAWSLEPAAETGAPLNPDPEVTPGSLAEGPNAVATDATADPKAAPLGGAPATDPTAVAGPPATARDSAVDDRIANLEQQLELMLKEVRSLKGSQPAATARRNPARLRTVGTVAPDGKIIAVISGEGEVHLLDAQSGKTMFRTQLADRSTIQSLAFSPDGKVLAIHSGSEVYSLDAATGKILRTERKTADPDSSQKQDPSAKPRPNKSQSLTEDHRAVLGESIVPTTARQRRKSSALNQQNTVQSAPTTIAAGSGRATSPLAGVQLDLVRLASEYSDAVGNVRLAQRMLEIVKSSYDKGVASQGEFVEAEVKVQNAQQKRDLLRGIATAALQAAKDELQIAETRYKAGDDAAADVAGAKAKLQMLSLIIDSQ
jgi:beta-lactamase regulating signal transducer with metallopeptidase domain